MTWLKRETDLWYGEPLYYLAALCSSFFSFFGGTTADRSPELAGLSSPKCDLWSFSTCRFNMYRHEELWPELLNCICFEVRAKRSATWIRAANRRPRYMRGFGGERARWNKRGPIIRSFPWGRWLFCVSLWGQLINFEFSQNPHFPLLFCLFLLLEQKRSGPEYWSGLLWMCSLQTSFTILGVVGVFFFFM